MTPPGETILQIAAKAMRNIAIAQILSFNKLS
jgi:hypothetical protein